MSDHGQPARRPALRGMIAGVLLGLIIGVWTGYTIGGDRPLTPGEVLLLMLAILCWNILHTWLLGPELHAHRGRMARRLARVGSRRLRFLRTFGAIACITGVLWTLVIGAADFTWPLLASSWAIPVGLLPMALGAGLAGMAHLALNTVDDQPTPSETNQ